MSHSPKPSEEQMKVVQKLAEELIRQELGNGMFTCDDDLDGCSEIVSDKIKECFESIKSIIADVLSVEFERGLQVAEDVASIRCGCAHKIRSLKGKTE